jgi:hypothetical protein
MWILLSLWTIPTTDENFVVSIVATVVLRVVKFFRMFQGIYILLFVRGRFWALGLLRIEILAWNIFSFYEMANEILKQLVAISHPMVAEQSVDVHSFFVVSLSYFPCFIYRPMCVSRIV